ncbi:MAG TPA: tetratricopeptide repeat protein [Tepidisphaeraceae bacterium]
MEARISKLEIRNNQEKENDQMTQPYAVWDLLLRALNLFRVSSFGFRILLLFVLVAAGCAAQPSASDKASLAAASRSVETQQYEQAIAQADTYLSRTPHGPGSAEALYLKGRGFEGRVAQNPGEAKKNLQAARSAYVQALGMKPSQQTEAAIRTSLANVAYFQDDYNTASDQWQAAYPKLTDANVKGWVLYRIGICQQRLGQFDRADQAFAQAQREFPHSVPAQRSREHQGARGFYVQLATFASGASADKAAAALKTQGVTPVKTTDSKGNQQLRVGPLSSYGQAMAMKSRFAGQYPDAMVVP